MAKDILMEFMSEVFSLRAEIEMHSTDLTINWTSGTDDKKIPNKIKHTHHSPVPQTKNQYKREEYSKVFTGQKYTIGKSKK